MDKFHGLSLPEVRSEVGAICADYVDDDTHRMQAVAALELGDVNKAAKSRRSSLMIGARHKEESKEAPLSI